MSEYVRRVYNDELKAAREEITRNDIRAAFDLLKRIQPDMSKEEAVKEISETFKIDESLTAEYLTE